MAINQTSRAPQVQLGPQTSMAVAAPPVTPRTPNMLETFLSALMEGGNGGGGVLRNLRQGQARPEDIELTRAQTAKTQAEADNVRLDARKKAAVEAFTQAAYGFYDPATGQQVPGSVDNLRSEGYGAATPDAILSLANRFGIPKDEAEAIAARARTAYALTPTSPLEAAFTGSASPTTSPAPAATAGVGRFDAETQPAAPAPGTLESVFTGGSAGLAGLPAVGGRERESMIAGLDVAAGGGPWGQNQGVDVNRLQSNIDADLKNNLDQQQISADASRDIARIQAGASIRAAEIREKGETDRAAARGQQDSLTEVFTAPKASVEDLNTYVNAYLPEPTENSAPPGLRGQIIARAQEYMANQFMQPGPAVERATKDYITIGPDRSFGGRQNTYRPNQTPVPRIDPRTASPSRVTERDVGAVRPPAPASVRPLPASRGELKAGEVYQTARGTARWNGTAFELVD